MHRTLLILLLCLLGACEVWSKVQKTCTTDADCGAVGQCCVMHFNRQGRLCVSMPKRAGDPCGGDYFCSQCRPGLECVPTVVAPGEPTPIATGSCQLVTPPPATGADATVSTATTDEQSCSAASKDSCPGANQAEPQQQETEPAQEEEQVVEEEPAAEETKSTKNTKNSKEKKPTKGQNESRNNKNSKSEKKNKSEKNKNKNKK